MTPSPRESRRSRIARSLGLSYVDQTGTDSQARTITAAEEGHSAFDESLPSTSDRKLYFDKVERVHTRTREMSESSADADLSTKRTRSNSLGGSAREPKSPGLKKNVWEVRKK